MTPDPCPAYITVAPGREVRCTSSAGHGPAEDMHHGLLRVILPDGREQVASLVWSTLIYPWDQGNLKRAE